MPSGDIYSDEKNFRCHPPIFPSLSHDIILTEAVFTQFSIVLCSELSVDVCVFDLFNLSSYENVFYVGLCN